MIEKTKKRFINFRVNMLTIYNVSYFEDHNMDGSF